MRNIILFNEVIMNLLHDCNLKNSEMCLSKRIINSANPCNKIGKILIKKNIKLVIEKV